LSTSGAADPRPPSRAARSVTTGGARRGRADSREGRVPELRRVGVEFGRHLRPLDRDGRRRPTERVLDVVERRRARASGRAMSALTDAVLGAAQAPSAEGRVRASHARKAGLHQKLRKKASERGGADAPKQHERRSS
jgi:hypothetical protein